MPTTYVSKLLGHTNLTTTSRYLNIHRSQLQLAMHKLEEHRSAKKAIAHSLHTTGENAPADVPDVDTGCGPKDLPS